VTQAGKQTVDHGNMTGDSKDSTGDQMELKDIECIRCKTDLTVLSKWYRCTCCPNFNMCEDCNSSDFHKGHMVYTQDFTPPLNPTLPYCSACGKHYLYKIHHLWFINVPSHLALGMLIVATATSGACTGIMYEVSLKYSWQTQHIAMT
jgi:hypothetical protein